MWLKKDKKKMLKEAGIDVETGMNRFLDDSKTYYGFLRKFKQDQNYARLCEAVAKDNKKEAFGSAHALKGVTANLSILSMYQILAPLVEELRHETDMDYEPELKKLKDAYDLVIKVIDKV